MKAWEPDEDQIIMDMHAKEGPKWKLIVKKLPGRTVSSVRNRWQRIEKGRKLREEGHELKNRCHACGQPKRGHICQAKISQVAIPESEAQPAQLMPPPTIMGSGPYSGPSSTGMYGGGPSSTSKMMPTSLSMPGVSPPVGLVTSAGAGPSGRLPGSAEMSGQPMLRRTRSGSKLVSAEDRARASGGLPYGIDVQNASNAFDQHGVYGADGQQPDLQRSNTSFFKSLASAGVFSPTSRDMFSSWAGGTDSPKPDGRRMDAAFVADDPAAPVSLRRIASLSQSGQNEGEVSAACQP